MTGADGNQFISPVDDAGGLAAVAMMIAFDMANPSSTP